MKALKNGKTEIDCSSYCLSLIYERVQNGNNNKDRNVRCYYISKTKII